MEPTPYTTTIAQQLLDALGMVRNTFVEETKFDPLTSRRLFTVRTRDITEVVHLPQLMQKLQTHAPHIKVRTVFKPIDETLSGLANGRIDFSLGFLPSLETGIHRRQLFRQHYVCVMREGHPLARQELTTELFCEQQHLLVEYSGSGHQILEKALIDAGARHQIKVRLPQYLSAPHFIIASDMLWCAPAILVQKLAPHFALITKPVPLQLPEFDIGIYWHDRYHREPGNKWLRDFIVNHSAEIMAESA